MADGRGIYGRFASWNTQGLWVKRFEHSAADPDM